MRLLRENLSLKAAALALALTVWYMVRGEERPLMIVTAPLELSGLPEDVAIAGDVPDSVNVRVRAPEVVLRGLTAGDFSARLDLAALEPGDHLVRIRPGAIRTPRDVELVKVNPEYLSVRVERKVHREVPVTPRIIGDPAPGHVLAGARVLPERVAIEGPESAVGPAREVLTDIVRIDGRTEPFESAVNLFPDRAGVTLPRERRAQLVVDVHERYVTRVLAAVKVAVAEGAANVRLDPETVDVTVEGPAHDLAPLTPDDLAVSIDLGGAEPRGRRALRLRPAVRFLPGAASPQVSIKSVQPEEIEVRSAAARAKGGRR